MYCTSCGKQINDEGKFCQFCGAKISQKMKEPEQSKSPIIPQIREEVATNIKNTAKKIFLINDIKNQAYKIRTDGVYRVNLKKNIRKMLIIVISLVVIISGGSFATEYFTRKYNHKKYEEKRNTLVEYEFTIDEYDIEDNFDTFFMYHYNEDFYENYSETGIQVESIDGMYVANLLGDIKEMNFTIKFNDIIDTYYFANMDVIYRKSNNDTVIDFNNQVGYFRRKGYDERSVDGFECAYDRSIGALKLNTTGLETSDSIFPSAEELLSNLVITTTLIPVENEEKCEENSLTIELENVVITEK